MSQTSTVNLNFTVGGIQFSSVETRAAEGVISHKVTLPAGIAGAITAAATGIDGLETGHGIEAADIVDVHWDDPSDGTHQVRRGLTVDTAGTNDITYDETPAGEGDALPAEDTEVVVAVQVVIDTDFDGDLLELAAMKSDRKSMIDIRTTSASKQAQKLAANSSWFWISDWGYTNPFDSATVDEVKISNGSVTAGTVHIAFHYQSV